METQEEARPWEQPGVWRRDCEPHRGVLLLVFANAVICSGLGIGILIGCVVTVLARRDLAKMKAGVMDPYGRIMTDDAHRLSVMSMVCGALVLLFWICVFAYFSFFACGN